MKKSKNTKRALILSITSILICGLMLIGSTFAWFTDSVTAGKNMIKAGNLDIEFYHSSVSKDKEKVDENTTLFEVDYWEPGVIAYENFEIVNVGDLSLKYIFEMSIGEYNTVLDNGKSLKDVLKVAILEGDEFSGTREDALALNFAKTLTDFELEGILNTKGSKVNFTIFVYWEPTDNDNDYNLNNDRTSSDNNPLFIDLGVSLSASQSTYESDTFGTDYDDLTVYKEVSTLEEFTSLIQNSSKGEGVRLTNDITVASVIPQSPSGVTRIDLNGHTITNTTAASTMIENGDQMIIKNGNLVLKQSALNNGVLKVVDGSTLTLDNVELTSTTGTGIFLEGKNSTANIVDSNIMTYGYVVTTNANSADHYGVVLNVKNSVLSGSAAGVGTVILINIPSTTNIENSTINGYLRGVVARGGTMTIKDSTINNTVGSYVSNWVHRYDDADWGQGDFLTAATLVIGNKHQTSYKYPTDVTLINTKINSYHTDDTDVTLPTVYIIGNREEGLGATLNYDDASQVGEVVRGNEYVTVNGE